METQKNIMLESLSEQLFQQRQVDRRKFSLRSVAQRINVSHSMLSQILKGKKKPSPILLRRLCEDLGMNENQKLQVLNDLLSMGPKAKKYLSPTDYQGYIQAKLPEIIQHEKSIQFSDVKNSELLSVLIKNYVDELMTLSLSESFSGNSQIVLSVKSTGT